MIIQSAQTLSYSSAHSSAVEKTAVLKSNSLYTGLRIILKHRDGGTFEDSPLKFLTKFVVNVPEYGNNSRRVDLDGSTLGFLPLICQLGAQDAIDAASATSLHSTAPITAITGALGYAQFDIPINKKNLDEDIRVTIAVKTEAAADIIDVEFAFLDYPMRSVFFRAYDEGDVASYQRWFPADGTLQGVAVAGYSTGWTDGHTNAFAFETRTNGLSQVSKISLNGEQSSTFDNPEVLGAALDEIVSGGPTGANAWSAKAAYGMFKNFPQISGASYINVDLASSNEYMTLGVMSDAS